MGRGRDGRRRQKLRHSGRAGMGGQNQSHGLGGAYGY